MPPTSEELFDRYVAEWFRPLIEKWGETYGFDFWLENWDQVRAHGMGISLY